MKKMAWIIEKTKIYCKLLKTSLNNVSLVTFTTLLHKTLKEVNTTATDVFFVKYTNKTAKDY